MKKIFLTSTFDIRPSIFRGPLSTCSLILLCLFGFGFFSSRSAGASEVEILTPRPGATIAARNPETHLVLRQPESPGVEKLQVQVNGTSIDPPKIIHFQRHNFLHFRLPLKPGMNIFTILPAGQRFEIRYQPLRADVTASTLGKDVYLFHQNDELPQSCTACHDLHMAAPIEPLGLKGQESCAICHVNILEKAKRTHSATANNLCLTCHQQFVKPWRIGFPTRKIEKNCVACHTGKAEWRAQEHIHGPLNVGGCTVCHNPHGEQHRYQLWAEGKQELCVTCHSDKGSPPQENMPLRFPHGIIGGAGCVACHDPHAADHQFLLAKPVNELCVSCHPSLSASQRGHPVGGHPVTGPTERRRPGRELSCVSCHDPHGSPFRAMLFATSIGSTFCRDCHK
jgi:predicted CXXCH cytochrome family protein